MRPAGGPHDNTMNEADRLAVLRWIDAQLSALMTADEQQTYPVLDHLQDLISDLDGGLEQDEG
jgi:hypothetical protein